ncbi:hypothetical protein [Burkholderia anthina]|uniref:hypothetical protein n=1 Tax=Burkholderia anthina TaxID=179879 RepID=UPI00158D7D6C|nr:hypothetical protein [Burkholderia anthina]
MSSNLSARPEQSTDASQLRSEIKSIDSVCQFHLDQIGALSKVTLLAMETPEFWMHPGTLRDLLGLIKYLANTVNLSAGSVGGNSINMFDVECDARVLDAFRKARESGAHHD